MTTLNKLIEIKSKEYHKKFDNRLNTMEILYQNHGGEPFVGQNIPDFLSQSIQSGYELAIKDVMELEELKNEDVLDEDLGIEQVRTEDRNEVRNEIKRQLQSLLKDYENKRILF